MISGRSFGNLLKRSNATKCYNQFNANVITLSTTIEIQCRLLLTSAKKYHPLQRINPNIVKMEHVVRGPLELRATEIEKELKKVFVIQHFSLSGINLSKQSTNLSILRELKNHLMKLFEQILVAVIQWVNRISHF